MKKGGKKKKIPEGLRWASKGGEETIKVKPKAGERRWEARSAKPHLGRHLPCVLRGPSAAQPPGAPFFLGANDACRQPPPCPATPFFQPPAAGVPPLSLIHI